MTQQQQITTTPAIAPGRTRWPQDQLQIPAAGARFMPPVERGNIDLARQESFTMSTTFNFTNVAAGQVLTNVIPTDQDGDFWCDQIACVGWSNLLAQSQDPPPCLVDIRDVRTGRSLTWPVANVPIKPFVTLQLFQGDTGVSVGNSPPPEGFRATSILQQPVCFTRQGGIQVSITFLYQLVAGTIWTVDWAFNGWKEYTYASQAGPVGR